MSLEYLIHVLVVAIPTVGGAVFAVWKQFKDAREDSQARRAKACAESAAILEEVDKLREAMQLLVEEVQFATQGARQVQDENRKLHAAVVEKETELAMLERRVAAIAVKNHEGCDCPSCNQ